MSKCEKYVKLSKRSQMSKSQTAGLERRFIQNDVNFDITSKLVKNIYFMNILRVFDKYHM